jgi:hypothetical protein
MPSHPLSKSSIIHAVDIWTSEMLNILLSVSIPSVLLRSLKSQDATV